MFRISDFSRFTRVSVKTLHHYDQLGLLKPAFVDPETGYRHYAARQVVELQRILALKEQGFALEDIGELLAGGMKGSGMVRLLQSKRRELEQRVEDDQSRLDNLVARLREIEADPPAVLADVVVSELPAIRVASRRAKVASLDDGIEELFEALEHEIAAARIRGPGPPLVLYHDRDHRETDADVEVAVPVLSDATRVAGARIRTLPPVPAAACVTYAGGYDQWADLLRRLLAWLEARRWQPAGPLREVFLQFGVLDPKGMSVPPGYLVDRPADQLTELQVPVERRPPGARKGRSGARRRRP